MKPLNQMTLEERLMWALGIILGAALGTAFYICILQVGAK